jgi:predicted nucleotidyltransferase
MNLIQNIQNFLTECPDIAAGYLFGSAVSKDSTVVNDIDILLLPIKGADKFLIYSDIKLKLARILGLSERRIDVLIFDPNDADLHVLKNAVNKGILLKNSDPEWLSEKIEDLSMTFLLNEPIMRRAKQFKRERLEAICEG